jgi:hypothetical protein
MSGRFIEKEGKCDRSADASWQIVRWGRISLRKMPGGVSWQLEIPAG